MSRVVVKDWPRWKAIETAAKILIGRWVDDQHKEKSRYVAREFGSKEDPTVFANASDHSTSRVVDLKAVKCGYPTWVSDVVSAFSRRPRRSSSSSNHLRSTLISMVMCCGSPFAPSTVGVLQLAGGKSISAKGDTSPECKEEGFTVVQCPKSPDIQCKGGMWSC